MTTEFIINHLWQSSCFALLTALLALVLRKNSPKVRYWVWLSASLKFLVPLALLMSLGSVIPWPAQRVVPLPAPVFPNALAQIAEPFTPVSYATAPVDAPRHWALVAIGIVWALGFVAITFVRCRSWFRIRAALRASTPIELPIPVPAFIATGASEPGIVGFLRPALVLPAGMLEHLNARQLDAVLAHELCHVRRRDNAFAAVHMVVEAIFWFHPLVWWIGSRMVEERELACDEEVLRMGCEPTDYVQGILKVCQLYAESPLPCVSGVTGADVKRRLRAILAGTIARELTIGKKLALAAIGLVALAVPVVIGVLNAPALRAQSTARPAFEVASVKPLDPAALTRDHQGHQLDGGRFVDRTDLLQFIVRAYVGGGCGVKVALREDCPLIAGVLPAWVKTDKFEIQAKLPADSPGYTPRQLRQGATPPLNLMLQVLLEDRFHLKVHRETRELPVWALTVARNGPKLKQTPPGGELRKGADGTSAEVHGFEGILSIPSQSGTPRSRLLFQASSMQEAAQTLWLYFDRPVLDRTGLEGDYDFAIDYDEDPDAPKLSGAIPNMFRGTGPALSIALQDVGLKLESTNAPVEVLVIDHVEKPSEN